ncbi:Glycosyltransferase, catalytic subunit of cellulose synthase and poly-beta-1,6-N-acetylglucosamine synthase [Cnuella takakiae]|uniref:Glycosyltransferase, catalytic subunit of cellulose synthase and poly-beta-1,6-N-acetylglucosamine synthase n=1 Tax=Cnuella takakiae TaxID=1302690 RepID=A0A1M5IJV7_9BACT|nr:glycosyltransferase [Cnuella takakiae]OLY92211.1 glycosyl transferase family 2 [Cnuella takakiae]SHG28557.1 Glycosyltransferase, catalytic subunit of cellulose synthase and poly-beta-1,6-N-acetylglucosamine synthase [Cnuella takakiae]
MNFWHTALQWFSNFVLVYSILSLGSYLLIALFSIRETRRYLRKLSFTNYRVLASSELAPSISLLATAYNEGPTILDNVRSLLSLHYENMELIIINDGSKDDTLEKLIKKLELVPDTTRPCEGQLACKPIKGVYRSTNPIYRKVVVIDKENGGKADAMNAGINLARNKYIVATDGDCILEQDALLKMVKPFLQSTNRQMIATGGVVRIINDCEVHNGRLSKINMPRNLIVRTQVLEYIRAFLLGRMAWSRINGLLIVSGAFGCFDRDVVIACGGYQQGSFGEDFDLVVSMRRYMEENGLPYRVQYIPEPLCWTEAPASFKFLNNQRNRWARGLIQTLWKHRKTIFNPSYGILGIVSIPYFLLFEFLAPFIEFVGFIIFLVLAITGMIDWEHFLALLAFVLGFGYLLSFFAILMEVSTFNQYRNKGDIRKLMFAAILEPFYFHPFVTYSAIRGHIDLLLKRQKGWGEMKRTGFKKAV